MVPLSSFMIFGVFCICALVAIVVAYEHSEKNLKWRISNLCWQIRNLEEEKKREGYILLQHQKQNRRLMAKLNAPLPPFEVIVSLPEGFDGREDFVRNV